MSNARRFTVNILGQKYKVTYLPERGNEDFFGIDSDTGKELHGQTCSTTKQIVVRDFRNPVNVPWAGMAETDDYCLEYAKKILSHEMFHAFFYESGLGDSVLKYDGGWCKNEEMIDWLALQFWKIKKSIDDGHAKLEKAHNATAKNNLK